MGILFSLQIIYLSSKWVSLLWHDNRIWLSSVYLEKTPILRKCQFLKKQSNVPIFLKGTPGNILDPERPFREFRDCATSALLPGVSGPRSRLLLSLDQPRGVPSPWEGAFGTAAGSHQSFERLQPHLQHSSNIFYATAKIFFWDGKSISFPTPFLKSKSEQTHLLFPSCF